MDDILLKRCTGPCGKLLPATTEYFHDSKRNKSGLVAACKKCKQEHCKEYQARPDVRQRRKARAKAYQARPEILQHRGELQRSRLAKPEARERTNSRRREHSKQPEVRARRRAEDRNREAHKKAVLGAHTSGQIQDQLKRQKHKCYYCHAKFQRTGGKYLYHIEHTFPISRVAGTDIPANSIEYLVLSCPTCNMSKGNKFPWEWAEGGRLL